jgi:arsenate reductase-like glutaredoxin family protein
MGKNEKTPITVNNIEYIVEDMTDEQRTMLNHANDLDRKLANARFNLDQLAVGREAFVNMLAQSLEVAETEVLQ